MVDAAAKALLEQALAHHNSGKLEAAASLYREILARAPEHFDALHLLGVLEDQQGRHEVAAVLIQRALALDPDHAPALYNRGNALRNLGRHDEAIASYERALALRPDHAQAHYNRGNALRDLKRDQEALASYDHALVVNPGYAEALNNRGNALRQLRRIEEALASYERALSAKPGFAEALNNRGNALRDLGRREEALASYEHALAMQPDYPEALGNRSNVLREMGRYEEAAASFEKLAMLVPGRAYASGDWLSARLSCSDWQDLEQHMQTIEAGILEGQKIAVPFSVLTMSDSAALQLQCARIYTNDKYPAASPALWNGEIYPHDRIRVAYLSGNFHNHALTALMAGLFETHDKARFDVTAISFGPDVEDDMRARLRRAFDRFIEAARMSDLDVALMLREMEIDIAVDLNGLSQGGRPAIFAQRAAPVQATYLGYLGTSGADYMDYIFADSHVIPVGHEGFYTENVVRLPDTFQVNDAKREIEAHSPSRADAGLPESGFVFCCFNNTYKITPRTFDIWMCLLGKVEGSVLWLLEDNAPAARNLRRACEQRGIAPGRLVFAPRVTLPGHLARHRLADLFLDTLPCNAGVTASDALWAGLPVLTCMGGAFVARVAGSLVHAVGLPELVTRSPHEYEALALKLATTPALLADVKTRLAHNRRTHPLFDTDRSRRHIESAYVAMWERYQRGEPPASFTVQPIQ